MNSEGLVQVDTDTINIENAVLDINISDITDSMDYVYQKNVDGGYLVSKYVESLGWYLVVQSNGANNDKIYVNLIYKNVITFFMILTVCIIMVASNLTIEKKRMEEHALEKERYAKEQEKLKKQADEANRAKGEFLVNMSHEIRTPINAVLGMDEMILRESRESGIQSYAADIKRAGNILLSLINDILDFSKIESGKMDIISVEYDLSAVLCELMDMIRTRAEEKHLLLELKVEPDTPAHLFGDEVRIRQIIINILTNAVKYTPEGKVTLTVSGKKVSEDSVQLYVSVKDTGIGIKEEDRERLFKSFQRVEETRNRNIEGTGLGLSITMRLLNLMGSRLELQSTYGEGSDFYFYLVQNADSEQLVLSVSASDENTPVVKTEDDIVDWEKGKTFCAGNEDFYTEILGTFLDAHSDRALSQYYEASDFENYRVKIHAVKTNQANIGAVDASDMAKKLELALKNEKDVNYVKAHHEAFIHVYKRVVSEVEKYIYGA